MIIKAGGGGAKGARAEEEEEKGADRAKTSGGALCETANVAKPSREEVGEGTRQLASSSISNFPLWIPMEQALCSKLKNHISR